MFRYERNLIKRAYQGTKRTVVIVCSFLSAQITDPAVRRAIILGCAAYFLRQLPFLDQSTAEGLSDKVLVVAGVILSKLPGTIELASAKQVLAKSVASVSPAPADTSAPSRVDEPAPEVSS